MINVSIPIQEKGARRNCHKQKPSKLVASCSITSLAGLVLNEGTSYCKKKEITLKDGWIKRRKQEEEAEEDILKCIRPSYSYS